MILHNLIAFPSIVQTKSPIYFFLPDMDPDSDSMNPDKGPDSMNSDTDVVSVNAVRMRIQWIRIWIRIQHFKWIRIRIHIQCTKDVQLQGKPSALKIEHQKIKFSNCFALLYTDLDRKSGYGSGLKIRLRIGTAKPDADTNPGTPLNPDPIRIRIRIHNIAYRIILHIYEPVSYTEPIQCANLT